MIFLYNNTVFSRSGDNSDLGHNKECVSVVRFVLDEGFDDIPFQQYGLLEIRNACQLFGLFLTRNLMIFLYNNAVFSRSGDNSDLGHNKECVSVFQFVLDEESDDIPIQQCGLLEI
ncbi:hypothetical protein J6590_105803, partial [Homalodisca vitripennis]